MWYIIEETPEKPPRDVEIESLNAIVQVNGFR